MLDFDTPFRRAVRALKAPNSAQFNPADWKSLLETQDTTAGDVELCAMAFWLFAQAEAIRRYYAKNPLPDLSQRQATTLAVATLNQQCAVAVDKSNKAAREARADGALSMDYLAHIGIGAFESNVDSISDAATDAVESWLFAAASQTGHAVASLDWARTAERCVKRFSLQRGHFSLWQYALWEDWRLVSDGQQLVFAPADWELAKLLDACLVRKQSNFMEYAWVDMSCWPQMTSEQRRAKQLSRTVIGLEHNPGRSRRFVIGRRPTHAKLVPDYVIGRAGLEGSYLASFLDRELPKAPGLTCSLLTSSWYVLLDLAEALIASRPRATFRNFENVRQWALIARRAEIENALRQSLALPDPVATEVVRFLSWEKGVYKGLWGAPLVPLPGSDEFAIAHNVLALSNPVRRVEIWLTKGGLDDNLSTAGRGDSYEAILRDEIATALSRNTIVAARRSAPAGIKKSRDFPEQIDLVVQFGSLCIIGEVKCFLFPADPCERFNFLRKVRAAAEQAKRKAAFLETRRDVLASALAMTPSEAGGLTIVPIAVINHGFGMSLEFDGCVATDAKFLKVYLAGGSFISESAVDRVNGGMATGEHHLYRTEQEAITRFVPTIRRPPTLFRFVDRLGWRSFGFPTYEGTPLIVARTELSDVSGATRERYETLQQLIETQNAA